MLSRFPARLPKPYLELNSLGAGIEIHTEKALCREPYSKFSISHVRQLLCDVKLQQNKHPLKWETDYLKVMRVKVDPSYAKDLQLKGCVSKQEVQKVKRKHLDYKCVFFNGPLILKTYPSVWEV